MNAHVPSIHSDSELIELFSGESAESINEFLSILDDTESPRDFLTWALIAAAGALIGRNAVLKSGPMFTVTGNLFVILLGPAGVRKSSAINLVKGFLGGMTLNHGPTDTGGQRHGIMSALSGLRRHVPHMLHKDASKIPPISMMMTQARASNDMVFFEPELGRLMGMGSYEMADFFVDLWDGEDIDYQTKAGETVLRSPLVSLLSATTPSSLAKILPDNAAGHGILSRMLFIYSDSRHKDVPLPPLQPEEWYERRARFTDRLAWIDSNRFNFGLTADARSTYEALYRFIPTLNDPRLEHYKERRAIMLLKVAMALAALRNDVMIIESDVRLSHELLALAEPNMSRALEYFGRNKAFQGRMIIIQFLRANAGGCTKAELIAAASSELNQREADEAIESMLASKEIKNFNGTFFAMTTFNELHTAGARPKSNR